MCLDVFIYISDDPQNTIIGLPTNNCHDPIDCFATCSVITMQTPQDVVLLAHMTNDINNEGNAQLVLLVYDILTLDSGCFTKTITERYLLLQSLVSEISQLKIGNVPCSLQWIGNINTCTLVKNMTLPHEHTHIVSLHNNFEYVRYAF